MALTDTEQEAWDVVRDHMQQVDRNSVSLTNLAGIIRGLCSTDTCDANVEYERACAEVFTEAAGLSMDYKETVAAALGLRIEPDPQWPLTDSTPLESIASQFESGWADGHTDHRDANLWESPFYRGGYLAASTRPFPETR